MSKQVEEPKMLKFRVLIGSHCQGFPVDEQQGDEYNPLGKIHKRQVMYRAGDIIECTDDLVKIYCKPGVTPKFERLHPETSAHLKDTRKNADPNEPYDISDPGSYKETTADQQKVQDLIAELSETKRERAKERSEVNDLKTQMAQLMDLLKAKNETQAQPQQQTTPNNPPAPPVEPQPKQVNKR